MLANESNAGALVQPLVGEAKATLKVTLAAMWPKTRQVLEVLRDQGLLLSVLLSLSAFFSMAETSITTLWPWKVRPSLPQFSTLCWPMHFPVIRSEYAKAGCCCVGTEV